jgi:hypothetical protein
MGVVASIEFFWSNMADPAMPEVRIYGLIS